jgi:hypothetical protein
LKPVLQALLVADHVYVDTVTGKKIVAGIFHRLRFARNVETKQVQEEGGEAEIQMQIAPGGHRAGSPFCYVSMTDVHGQQDFELRYVDLARDQVLLSTKFRVDSKDPVQTVEVILPLPLLPNQAGGFALELLWNNEHLGSHRITVEEIQPGA